MTRDRLVWLLALLALVAGGWWLKLNTEWVDEDRPRPAQGEARDNPVYAFGQLLKRLGMQVERHEALDALPPPQARLVLLSGDWELMPERGERLRQWVLGGGHLLVLDDGDWHESRLSSWVPITSVYVKTSEPPKAVKAAMSAASGPERATLESSPPLWGETDSLVACHSFSPGWTLRAKPGHVPTWSLARVEGTPATRGLVAQQDLALQGKPTQPAAQALRVAVGQGSVTVLNAGLPLFFNTGSLQCDNPLLLAGAVQAEAGATAWIYLHEKREALLPWLWHQGWIAILACALALAAALWRAAVRFGPRLAPPPRLRRSISEQVRGLGAYLQRGGSEALLAAQQRALVEVATRTLPRFARLPVGERARAIAAATGLAAAELATALAARFCTRAELPQHLQLLETARRRLHKTSARPPEERHPPS